MTVGNLCLECVEPGPGGEMGSCLEALAGALIRRGIVVVVSDFYLPPDEAVRALEACPSDRAVVDRHILAVATYLGHVSVASTYWYLHATPRLMVDIADACEAWRVGGSP